MSCGQNNNSAQNADATETSEIVENDSAAIMQTFEKLKTDKKFLKDVGLENEKTYSWNDDMVKIISGDLDNDGTADALVGFTVEGRGGGNNYDMHYAILLQKNNQYQYQNQFDANAGSPELFYGLKKIENGIIKGAIMGNNDDDYEIPVEFIFKNNELVNTFTTLHKTETAEREYISVSEILTPENVSVPLTTTLKEYQQLLGKGTITEPDLTVECGTYFDEGEYRELRYPNLIFELNDQKKAAFQTLTFKNSGYKLQTDKGTITEKTTLKELQSVLYKTDSWWMYEEEDGGKTLAAPDGEESDNQLKFHFDKNGNLMSVKLFIPC
jgi:hypothetical protein